MEVFCSRPNPHRVRSGKTEKLPLGRLFANETPETHSSQTSLPDGAVSPSSTMVLMDEHPHPREPLWKGLDEAAIEGFNIKL